MFLFPGILHSGEAGDSLISNHFAEYRCAVQVMYYFFNGGRDVAYALNSFVSVAHVYAESDFIRPFRFRNCDYS